jgi:hypothetical protein
MIPTEHEEQKTLCKYLDLKKIKYHSVPNANILSSLNKQMAVRVMQKLKREGLKKGTPDIVVFLPNKILYIEMKRIKASITSKEQIEWIEFINTLPYAKGKICKGSKVAIEFVENELRKL